jgi:alginate O-acetyltransferase complex protein AlgI
MALYADQVFGMAYGDLATGTAWIGILAYTFQIYFDFSGYSDMAIGLGDMLGFHFSENFNYPYAAASVTEFWRRWHISLGTWFREYVYIPLGGNKVRWARHILNVMVVWLLTGLWHGAGWTFIIWGVFYGVLLIFEKYVLNKLKIPKAVRWVLTMLAVIVGWVIFSADDLSGAGRMLASMTGIPAIAAAVSGEAGAQALFSGGARYFFAAGGILLAIEAFFSGPWIRTMTQVFRKYVFGRILLTVFAVAVLVLSIAFLATENYNPFLYFRF